MNPKARYYLSLLALAMGGSSIWLLQYIRYVFYDPMLQTLGCTNAQLGALTTISSVAGWVFIPINGMMATKFESKKLIVLAMLLNGGAAFFFAMNTTYTGAIITWCLLAFSVGLGYWASLIKMINGLAGPESSARSFSIYYGIYGVFAACVNVAEIRVGAAVGFRGTVLVIGAVTFTCGILDLFLLESDKAKAKRLGLAEEADGETIETKEKVKLSPANIKRIILWPGFWMLGLIYLFTYTPYAQISYYNPWLINVMGVSAETSATFSVIRTYLFMLWCPLGGILADKVFKCTYKAFMLLFAISAVLLAGTLVFGWGLSPMAACIYSVIPAIFIMPLYSITNSCIRELHINPLFIGASVAWTGWMGTPVDALWPVMFGRWIDVYGNNGFRFIFLFLAADCIVGLLFAMLIGRHHKKCVSGERVQLVEGQEKPATCEW